MPALCQSYETADEAHRAVAALRDSGMPPDRVHVLMGAEMHDALREASGTFAAERSPDAVVGAFAGDRPAGGVRGSFAPGEAAGPERSFGAADRDVVVTYADGGERVRVAGHRALKGLLMDAGLDDAAAEADVEALHAGRVLVLVDLGDTDAERAQSLLDGAVAARER